MGLSWYQWLATGAAAIAVGGFVWARVVRPLARGVRRLGALMDRIAEILEHWPEMQASVIAHSSELTELALQVGVLDGRQQRDLAAVRRDVNELWRRYRHSQGEQAPSSRGGPSGQAEAN